MTSEVSRMPESIERKAARKIAENFFGKVCGWRSDFEDAVAAIIRDKATGPLREIMLSYMQSHNGELLGKKYECGCKLCLRAAEALKEE